MAEVASNKVLEVPNLPTLFVGEIRQILQKQGGVIVAHAKSQSGFDCEIAFHHQPSSMSHLKAGNTVLISHPEISGLKIKVQTPDDSKTLMLVPLQIQYVCDIIRASLQMTCWNSLCGKNGALMKCTGCKEASYCDKNCQTSSWKKDHRKSCKHISSIRSFMQTTEQEQKHRKDNRKQQTATTEQQQKRTFNKLKRGSLPDFDIEYKKAFPKENRHFNILQDVKQDFLCGLRQYNVEGEMSSISCLQRMSLQSFSMPKRWGPKFLYSSRFKSFLQRGPSIGDVFDTVSGTEADGYIAGDFLFQTMRNVPVHQQHLQMGKTHVAIGFVDLHQLIMTEFEPGDSAQRTRFFGFEMSAVSVGRSVVVYDMMRKSFRPESILQVMFSSVWDQRTKQEFQLAVQSVLEQQSENLSDEVKLLLTLWFRDSDKKFLEGKKHWEANLSDLNVNFMQPLFLKYERDRVEYARYMLTGKMFAVKSMQEEFANVTMIDTPDLKRHKTESFFQTLNPIDVLDYKESLMTTIETLTKHRLERLMKLVQANEIVCSFRHEAVSTENVEALNFIRGLKPATIDWSNIVDYVSKEEFVSMVKRCSSNETTHRAHFMNWQQLVFGASFMDYPDKKDLIPCLQSHEKEYEKYASSKPYIVQVDRALWQLKPLNIVEEELARKLHANYLSYFFDHVEIRLVSSRFEDHNIFCRAPVVFFVEFECLH